MLSQTHGASFITFGTMNQATNGSREQQQRTRGGLPRLRGQGRGQDRERDEQPGIDQPEPDRMFSVPWSQPNSNPKNVPALAMLSCVDHQICGRASSERGRRRRSTTASPAPLAPLAGTAGPAGRPSRRPRRRVGMDQRQGCRSAAPPPAQSRRPRPGACAAGSTWMSLPEERERDQGDRQAQQQAALRDQQGRDRVAPSKARLASDRVVVGQVGRAARTGRLLARPGILEQQQPAQPAAEQHQDGGE